MLLRTHMQISSYITVPPAGYLYDWRSMEIDRFSRASNARSLCNFKWNWRKLQSLFMPMI